MEQYVHMYLFVYMYVRTRRLNGVDDVDHDSYVNDEWRCSTNNSPQPLTNARFAFSVPQMNRDMPTTSVSFSNELW